MGGFDDYSLALEMRDVIKSMIRKEVASLRPEPRVGAVYDFSAEGGWADILFAGDTAPLRVSASRSNTPMHSILSDGDDADIVRVSRVKSGYFISEVMTSPGTGDVPTTTHIDGGLWDGSGSGDGSYDGGGW